MQRLLSLNYFSWTSCFLREIDFVGSFTLIVVFFPFWGKSLWKLSNIKSHLTLKLKWE